MFKQGHYWLKDGTLECHSSAREPRGNTVKKVWEVPKDMELLILGRRGLSRLLGAENLDAREELVKNRRGVKAFSQMLLPVKLQSTYHTLSLNRKACLGLYSTHSDLEPPTKKHRKDEQLRSVIVKRPSKKR